jgi:magnesium transporter
MPELTWRYGYPAFWAVMVTTFGGMLWFFKRRGWLGGDSKTEEPSE